MDFAWTNDHTTYVVDLMRRAREIATLKNKLAEVERLRSNWHRKCSAMTEQMNAEHSRFVSVSNDNAALREINRQQQEEIAYLRGQQTYLRGALGLK
jgi:predicted nuclease with TOPRIM domain